MLAVVLGLAGISMTGYALTHQDLAPQLPATGAGSQGAGSSAPPTPAPSTAPQAATGLAPATPTFIQIPAIDVASPVNAVGLNRDGTMQVPQPGPRYDQAAWYRYSPTPGELGPSVIIGHIDSAANGPSVFFTLSGLEPGQRIRVDRADRTTLTFEVDSVRSYPKSSFPAGTVYGNTSRAELRLITCGGDFDHATRQYLDNIVVFAHLVGGTGPARHR